MSGFDNILNDLKAVTDEVGKKANETFEISKLSLERAKIKSRVQQNYQRLGEIVYGGHKNDEDVSDIVAVLYEQLDDDFARIEEIYNEICAVKAGAGVADVCEDEFDDMDEEAAEAEQLLLEMEAEAPEAEEAEEPAEAPEAPEEETPSEEAPKSAGGSQMMKRRRALLLDLAEKESPEAEESGEKIAARKSALKAAAKESIEPEINVDAD